jgi:hypothetical protein
MRYYLDSYEFDEESSRKTFSLIDKNYDIPVKASIRFIDKEYDELVVEDDNANMFDLYKFLVQYDKRIYKTVPDKYITDELNRIVSVFSDTELRQPLYLDRKRYLKAYKKEELHTAYRIINTVDVKYLAHKYKEKIMKLVQEEKMIICEFIEEVKGV